MKKLILGLSILLIAGVQLLSQAVLIYNSDDPYSSAAAAVVDQKRGINYILDCAENDSAAQVAWFATLPKDTSLFYAYVLADTSRNPVQSDEFLGLYLDSIDIQVLGDSSMTYYLGSANASKCEMAWDSLYAGIVPPLIIGYLSDSIVWYDRADASAGTDTTIVKANPSGWTDSTWIGDYVWITAGTNIGEARMIEDLRAKASGDADTIEVSAAFTAAITSTSDFTVAPSSIYTNWAFYDMYAYYGVLVAMDDIVADKKSWDKLLNDDGKLNSLSSGSSQQNRTFLSSVISKGYNIFLYLLAIN